MSKEKKSNIEEKIPDGYHKILGHLKGVLDDLDRDTGPAIYHAIELAKERAIQLGELTQAQAMQISDYLKRDIVDIAHFMADAEISFQETLNVDLQYLEDKFLENFFAAADRAKIDLLKFNLNLMHKAVYSSGEIIGIGTLRCTACGKLAHFYDVAMIEPCVACGNDTFERHLTAVE